MLSALTTVGSADDPDLSGDGLQMVYDASPTTVSTDQDVMISQRASRSVEFTSGALLNNVNVPSFSDSAPSITADGLTLAFNSSRNGTADLFITTRPTSSSAFAAPIPIDSLNTPNVECCASLAPDGSSMVFVGTTGAQRIVRSVRDTSGTFGPPTELDPVLTGATGQDLDESLTADGTAIVFVSNRNAGVGGSD